MTLYMIRGDTVTAYASPPARGSDPRYAGAKIGRAHV